MKQHFTIEYDKALLAYIVFPVSVHAENLVGEDGLIMYSEKNEITQGCINRIVDNLNKLAEHNAKNGGINEV